MQSKRGDTGKLSLRYEMPNEVSTFIMQVIMYVATSGLEWHGLLEQPLTNLVLQRVN